MESASKALLMAAGVLLGLMIISLGVYLFTNFAGTSSRIHDNIEENQITQFNSQFTSYVGKDNVTIYDVVSMAKLATQNNQSNEFTRRTASEVTGNDRYISVICNNVSIELGYDPNKNAEERQKEIETKYNTLISDEVNAITDSTGLTKYTVQVQISDITKRVYKVICTKIT